MVHPDRDNQDSLPARRLYNRVRVHEGRKQHRMTVRRLMQLEISALPARRMKGKPSGSYHQITVTVPIVLLKAARPTDFERIQFHFVWGTAIIVLAAFSLALYRPPPQEDAMFWSPVDVHDLLR
jgi:hypothetical protein